MTLLHDYFNTRNLQAFQRLLDGSSSGGGSHDRASSAGASTSPGGPGFSYPGTGKSSNHRSGGMSHADPSFNVNARDWLGRTVLHLVCATPESASVEYARALLKHPHVDVNLQDAESMWTPLHRALYAANLPVALLLLQRSDIDTAVKDSEGYTAIDLYNSTVNGTKPDPTLVDAELYTWGTNKNAALGLSDGDDRVHPDHVIIRPKDAPVTAEHAQRTLAARFAPIPVREVHMSKLHTVVVTGEREGNLRVCGFGSGGRLGTSQHMQYSLKPLPALPLQITHVAVGQDHTLALTAGGDVYSWGLNRFAQLGYVVDASSNTSTSTTNTINNANANNSPPPSFAFSTSDEPIQPVPKRIVGPLRRERVRGVAASRNASACWTADAVFTWGTHTGQLGYPRSFSTSTNAHGQTVTQVQTQVLPRAVSRFAGPVVQLAMSETVLVALLETHAVECVWNDRHFRISFPTHAFPSGIEPYRPPHSTRDSRISKVTCCDDMFAALSANGEVFTFTAPSSSPSSFFSSSSGSFGPGTSAGADGGAPSGEGRVFRPQRVWALRKKFSAVKDVALGADGSIIVCTESGHVFVRTRNVAVSTTNSTTNASTTGGGISGSSSSFKFTRIPFLQRVTRVCANASGAFGALRVDYRTRGLSVSGGVDGAGGVGQDLGRVMPFLVGRGEEDEDERSGRGRLEDGIKKTEAEAVMMSADPDEREPEVDADAEGEGEEDGGIETDVARVLELCDVLVRQRTRQQEESDANANADADAKADADAEAATAPETAHTFVQQRFSYGADALVHVDGCTFAVHRVVLAARSRVLRGLLSRAQGGAVRDDSSDDDARRQRTGIYIEARGSARLAFGGCRALTVLVLLRYLYADEVLAVWDRRIGSAVVAHVHAHAQAVDVFGVDGVAVAAGGGKANAKANAARNASMAALADVRREMQALARMLDMPALDAALEAPVKREPARTLGRDLRWLFERVQVHEEKKKDEEEEEEDHQAETGTVATASAEIPPSPSRSPSPLTLSQPLTPSSPLHPDVILVLADREVRCHSVILRARSPLFASFFGLEDWTANRRDGNGVVRVDMCHMRWDVVRFVVRFMCCGEDAEMFDVLDFINSVEELVQFMFQVLAAANELLLDRLVLLCSSVILTHTNISNACYILADASHYHVYPLIEKVQEYISANLEAFLENRILDELPHALVKQLAQFVRARQVDKAPFARGGAFVREMLRKHAEWLSVQDVPEVFVRSARAGRREGAAAKGLPGHASAPSPTAVGSPSRKWTALSKMSAPTSKTPNELLNPPQTLRRPPSGDDIFAMDDHADLSTASLNQESASKLAMPMPPVKSSTVWKAQGVPRVDMKTVMAEAASRNQNQNQTQASPSRPRVAGTTRSPLPAGGSAIVANDTASKRPLSQPSGSGSPLTWRVNNTADQSTARVPGSSMAQASSTPPAAASALAFHSVSGSPKDASNMRPPVAASLKAQAAPTTPGRAQQPPGLGPVITPARQTSSKGSSAHRNLTGSKAWTHSQPFPNPAPSPTAPTKGVSFVAIQHSQQEQVAPARDKRSLREIQDEERDLQAEADFMKWWTAEEMRVQAEQEQEALALAQFQSNLNNNNNSSSSKKPKRHNKPKGPPKAKPDAGASASPEASSSQIAEPRPPRTPRRQPQKPRQKSHADP